MAALNDRVLVNGVNVEALAQLKCFMYGSIFLVATAPSQLYERCKVLWLLSLA